MCSSDLIQRHEAGVAKIVAITVVAVDQLDGGVGETQRLESHFG